MTFAQLVEAGTEALGKNSPRTALDVLKVAAKKHGPTGDLEIMLFRAYAMRARQLREKGPNTAAIAMTVHAVQYMGDAADISEDDIITLVSACSGKDVFAAYNRYVRCHDRSLQSGEQLAGHLFRE